MKQTLIALMLLGLAACAQGPRKPSSTIFTCRFSEKIAGSVKHFEFIPDDHALMVDKTDVAFEESDFASGAFVYRTLKKDKEWKGELVFTSYEQKPHVYLNLQKSPLSSSPLTLMKSCE